MLPRWDHYRVKISIALAFRSVDPIRSLDLFTRLLVSGRWERQKTGEREDGKGEAEGIV